jgi:hypothetical protein
MRAHTMPSFNMLNKNLHVILFFLLLSPFVVSAQSVGIGTNTPDPSAQLEVSNPSKGMLIPRMGTTDIPLIANPAKGLFVYDSSLNKFMVNIGSPATPNWQPISSGASVNGWNTIGNAGLSAGTNFIGTTDAVPLSFRINNIRSGVIDSAASNTGLGFRTLDSLSSGTHNTGLGYKAVVSNKDGIYNTGLGSNALRFNTSGSNNVAVGMQALTLNKTGGANTAVGASALLNNVSASFNTAVGTASLFANKISNYNTAVGYQSLYATLTGNNNSAIGYNALNSNQSGSNNVAIGDYAAYGSNGSYNTVVGSGAGINNTGQWTTMIGVDAGSTNQVNGSVFVGSSAGRYNISGVNNSFIGDNAGYTNLSGHDNTALGARTLYLNQGGHNNTAIGSNALKANNSGSDNIAIGALSAEFSNGQENLMIGNNTGASDISGTKLTLLGHRANVLQSSLDNATAIGANARIGIDNAISLGDSTLNTTVGIGTSFPDKAGLVVNQTVGGYVNAMFGSNTTGLAIESVTPAIGFNSYFAAGSRKFIANGYGANINLDPSNGILYLHTNGNGIKDAAAPISKGVQLFGSSAGANYLAPTTDNNFSLGTSAFRWTTVYATNNIISTSDVRQKKNIEPLSYGLKEIMAMKPVTYQWINAAAGNQRMLGLLAQDIQQITPEIVEENDGMLGMRSAELIPVLIKGMQEQQAKMDAMQKEIDLLKKMISEKK